MAAPRMINAGDVHGRNFNICGIGDSLTTESGQANGNSWYQKVVDRSGGALRNVGNFAISGKRSDEILDVQVPQAIASGAGTCFILWGANDVSQAQSGFLAALKANVAKAVTRLREAGVEPVFVLMPPTNTSANVPATVAYNVWLTLYCKYNGIVLIDAWTDLATGAGAYQAGLYNDAIHWNTVGADLVAARALTALQKPYAALPLLAFTDTGSDAGTYVHNAISFTDTNSDGTPDNWFASGSGGTNSITAADANDLGKWLRCTMTAQANAGVGPTAVTLASLGWSIGDTLILGCKFRWADASQALVNSIYFTGITPNNQPFYQQKGGATGESLLLQREVVISAGTVIGLNAFAAGTGYFEINRPIVVNKTLLGF